MLALSYDDGPGPVTTPQMIETLARFGAKATFFLLGCRASLHPEIIDRLAAAGHELGCHTHDHLNAWRHWPWRVAADIDRGYESLRKWVPRDGLFRPPYGKSTPFTRWQLRRRGARVVRWTHDSMDTTHGPLPATADIVGRVMRDGGGIVLLHDFDRARDERHNSERRQFVLDVTTGLLSSAVAAGMRIVTVGEYLRRSQSSSA